MGCIVITMLCDVNSLSYYRSPLEPLFLLACLPRRFESTEAESGAREPAPSAWKNIIRRVMRFQVALLLVFSLQASFADEKLYFSKMCLVAGLGHGLRNA